MSDSNNVGYALRAPGSFNPRTNSYMKVAACNLSTLIARLPPQNTTNADAGCPKREKYPFVKVKKRQKKRTNRKGIPEDNLEKNDLQNHTKFEDEWAARYPINEPSSRNDALKTVVQVIFNQVTKNTARRIAECQFRQKTAHTEADLEEHLRDFETLWTWCEKTFGQSKLNEHERTALNSLKTETERDAFRILWSFNAYADNDAHDDFPIAQENFGCRLGLTRQGAAKLIKRFTRYGIIERTVDYIPHLKAARYRWLVGSPFPQTLSPESALPDSEAERSPEADSRGQGPLSKIAVDDVRCDLQKEPVEEGDKSQIVLTFGDQVIALLTLHGRLSPAELRGKILGYNEHSEACEHMLRRFRLQLTIDVDADGRYRLGPEKQHFKLLKALGLLKFLAGTGLADTDAQFESLSAQFGIDIDDFKRARDALLELGRLTRRDSRLFTVGELDD